ncbi:MAG: hypothetical protein ACOCSL_04885 [Thermoplasmatota archaeon]
MLKMREYFKEDGSQRKVAKFLLKNGLSIETGEIYCDKVKIPKENLSEHLRISVNTIDETIDLIEDHIDLKEIFRNLRPTAYFGRIADQIDAGVIEITPTDPHGVGILAGVTKIIADFDISIRQCLTEDSELKEDPKLIVITEDTIPLKALEKIREVEGIEGVELY